MKEDKNKKSELGKNELGEISGGVVKPKVTGMPENWNNIRSYYGVPNNPSSWGEPRKSSDPTKQNLNK